MSNFRTETGKWNIKCDDCDGIHFDGAVRVHHTPMLRTVLKHKLGWKSIPAPKPCDIKDYCPSCWEERLVTVIYNPRCHGTGIEPEEQEEE